MIENIKLSSTNNKIYLSEDLPPIELDKQEVKAVQFLTDYYFRPIKENNNKPYIQRIEEVEENLFNGILETSVPYASQIELPKELVFLIAKKHYLKCFLNIYNSLVFNCNFISSTKLKDFYFIDLIKDKEISISFEYALYKLASLYDYFYHYKENKERDIQKYKKLEIELNERINWKGISKKEKEKLLKNMIEPTFIGTNAYYSYEFTSEEDKIILEEIAFQKLETTNTKTNKNENTTLSNSLTITKSEKNEIFWNNRIVTYDNNFIVSNTTNRNKKAKELQEWNNPTYNENGTIIFSKTNRTKLIALFRVDTENADPIKLTREEAQNLYNKGLYDILEYMKKNELEFSSGTISEDSEVKTLAIAKWKYPNLKEREQKNIASDYNEILPIVANLYYAEINKEIYTSQNKEVLSTSIKPFLPCKLIKQKNQANNVTYSIKHRIDDNGDIEKISYITGGDYALGGSNFIIPTDKKRTIDVIKLRVAFIEHLDNLYNKKEKDRFIRTWYFNKKTGEITKERPTSESKNSKNIIKLKGKNVTYEMLKDKCYFEKNPNSKGSDEKRFKQNIIDILEANIGTERELNKALYHVIYLKNGVALTNTNYFYTFDEIILLVNKEVNNF